MKVAICLSAFLLVGTLRAQPDAQWLTLEGKGGPGAGRHIVFVSGDEEYRSDESLPMLAKILAARHGFKCTVLFAVNKQSIEIDPNTLDNIPGLHALDTADLMVICTRFRDLPDEQMKFVEAQRSHPILPGVETMWEPSDVYLPPRREARRCRRPGGARDERFPPH